MPGWVSLTSCTIGVISRGGSCRCNGPLIRCVMCDQTVKKADHISRPLYNYKRGHPPHPPHKNGPIPSKQTKNSPPGFVSVRISPMLALDTENYFQLGYIRGLRTLLVLALFINFLGIAYQLPGSYVTERVAGLTSHLRAMGLRDFPRIMYVPLLT